jgi:hypothetical protein
MVGERVGFGRNVDLRLAANDRLVANMTLRDGRGVAAILLAEGAVWVDPQHTPTLRRQPARRPPSRRGGGSGTTPPLCRQGVASAAPHDRPALGVIAGVALARSAVRGPSRSSAPRLPQFLSQVWRNLGQGVGALMRPTRLVCCQTSTGSARSANRQAAAIASRSERHSSQ